MKTQKYLIQKFPEKGFGLLYLWTPTLSKRDDMKPYDGEVPESMRVRLVDAQPVAVKAATPCKTSMDGNAVHAVDGVEVAPPISAVPGGAPAEAIPVVVLTAKSGAVDDAKAPAPEAQDDTDDGKPADIQDMTPSFTPEEKHVRLMEIIGKWTPGDPEHFTTTGLPRLDSLMADLGADVEGRERDAAWQAFCALHQTKK